jgi:hypothetical protein
METATFGPDDHHMLLCIAPAALQELDASAQAVGSAAAAVVSLQVMEAVVSEFSLVTASALGLSWEFHESCRNQLEVRPAACGAWGWQLQRTGNTSQLAHAVDRKQRIRRCSSSNQGSGIHYSYSDAATCCTYCCTASTSGR